MPIFMLTVRFSACSDDDDAESPSGVNKDEKFIMLKFKQSCRYSLIRSYNELHIALRFPWFSFDLSLILSEIKYLLL